MTRSVYHFSPESYERELTEIIQELLNLDSLDSVSYERILRRYPKDGDGFFSKSHLVRGFRHLNRKLGWGLDEQPFVDKLRMKPVRTQSGVAPVTVLTKPYPCPGRCIFCPSDVRMPKSYLSSEPGAQRAAQHQFDPYRQTFSRLSTYHNIGHRIDKVELIILGGTWSSYPEPYQIWFVKRCFEAMNDFCKEDTEKLRDRHFAPTVDFRHIEELLDGRHLDRKYNDVVGEFLHRRSELHSSTEVAGWGELAEAQAANEEATARCVGLVLETRPDVVNLREVRRMRRLGATKIQIGFQSLSDTVLKANRRGHDVTTTRSAMRLLRGAGFKIHAHWMPNLYGSSPELDLSDYDRIFADADFRPDEIKIYPCSLVSSAELMTYHASGQWRPYSEPELLRLVAECLHRTPEYCRVTRVVRDIPGPDIVDGSRVTNLREACERELARRGTPGREIRRREIRHRSVRPSELSMRSSEYETSVGQEIFLEYVTPADRIAAFLRLSLPSTGVPIEEIRSSAMIREIHVYGLLAAIGQRHGVRSQHLGLGRRLLEHAATIAARRGYSDLAVVSSVGTRPYYRRHGFRDGELYQHRSL